jgi:ankyrin repeat protein
MFRRWSGARAHRDQSKSGREAHALFEAIAASADAPDADGAIEALLDRGVDPNARDERGRTAFLAACAGGHLRAAALLLARGADVRARDDGGATALLALLEGAARARSLADLAALRSQLGASVDALRAVARAIQAKVRRLGEGPPPVLLLPEGFRELFDAILDGGAAIDAVDELGRDALAIAVCEAYPRPIVEALLLRGADPHRADEDGLTALDFADLHPDPEVRGLLAARR